MIESILSKIPDNPRRRPGDAAISFTADALEQRGFSSKALAVLLQCVDIHVFTDPELTALSNLVTERGVTPIRAGEFKRLLSHEFPVNSHPVKYVPFILDWDQWVFNDVSVFMPLLKAYLALNWREDE